MTTKRKLVYLALTANAIIWGSAFPIVKPVFDYLTPLQFLYLRFLVSGIISFPIFLYFYIKIHPKISYLLKVLLLELLGTALPILILYEGLSKTSALEASLIGATGPILVVIGSMVFLREKESRREWQGLGLSFLGSLVLILEPIWNGHTLIGSSLFGNIYILGYNFLYALYAIVAKKFYKTKPPLYFGALTYFATALIYGLLLFNYGFLPPISILYSSFDILFPVLYMALPGGILAFSLYLYAASKIEVSEANLFTYLNGVVAIPAAFFLLGETPSQLTLIAIIIIAYGVYRAEQH